VTKGLFITGTDTNVGKTVVSAALMLRYRAEARLCYWKPIQTGIEIDDDTNTVRELVQAGESEIFASGIRLARPLSPHLSARLAGINIEIESLVESLPVNKTAWIIEGAGGLFVPINEVQLMIDLIARLALPVVIVARATLGTINHTLLTLAALREHKLVIAGVVMVGQPDRENRLAIEHYGKVDVVAELPHFTSLNQTALADWARASFDSKGLLQKYLL
jgi:dethiobiotin synthetase